MKPFNLEEALKGAPVKLRNGAKAYVLANVKDLFPSTETARPLYGVHSFCEDCNDCSADESWTLTGRSLFCGGDDNDYDIVSMWEEPELTKEQVLEKAYQEDLEVTLSRLEIDFRYKVVAKTKDGDYVLKSDDGRLFTPSVSYEDVQIYEEKSPTVTVTLPRPYIPKDNSRYWFIYLNHFGGLFVMNRLYDIEHSEKHICFRTQEDAQAWIDAMKGALDE